MPLKSDKLANLQDSVYAVELQKHPSKFRFLLLFTGAAAGIAICQDVERSYRKRFLEQSLINELIDRDPLTGLKNRRAFDEHVTRVWQLERSQKDFESGWRNSPSNTPIPRAAPV